MFFGGQPQDEGAVGGFVWGNKNKKPKFEKQKPESVPRCLSAPCRLLMYSCPGIFWVKGVLSLSRRSAVTEGGYRRWGSETPRVREGVYSTVCGDGGFIIGGVLS